MVAEVDDGHGEAFLLIGVTIDVENQNGKSGQND